MPPARWNSFATCGMPALAEAKYTHQHAGLFRFKQAIFQ